MYTKFLISCVSKTSYNFKTPPLHLPCLGLKRNKATKIGWKKPAVNPLNCLLWAVNRSVYSLSCLSTGAVSGLERLQRTVSFCLPLLKAEVLTWLQFCTTTASRQIYYGLPVHSQEKKKNTLLNVGQSVAIMLFSNWVCNCSPLIPPFVVSFIPLKNLKQIMWFWVDNCKYATIKCWIATECHYWLNLISEEKTNRTVSSFLSCTHGQDEIKLSFQT